MVHSEKQSEQRLAELELIREESGGVLSPDAVVEFARDEQTALHACFTWDDGEAAHAYRLWEARQVIRVCVTVRDDVKGPPIRTYVSLYDDRGEDGYRLLTDVLSDAELSEKLLSQALGELKSWQQKYAQLQALAPVFVAANRVHRKNSGGGNGTRKRMAAATA